MPGPVDPAATCSYNVGSVKNDWDYAKRGSVRKRARDEPNTSRYSPSGAAPRQGKRLMQRESPQDCRRRKFLEEMQREVSDPLHKRLIQACEGDNAVERMESELGKMLLEILHRED